MSYLNLCAEQPTSITDGSGTRYDRKVSSHQPACTDDVSSARALVTARSRDPLSRHSGVNL